VIAGNDRDPSSRRSRSIPAFTALTMTETAPKIVTLNGVEKSFGAVRRKTKKEQKGKKKKRKKGETKRN